MSRKYFMLFEHRRQPLAPRKVFLKRVTKSVGAAVLLLGTTILMGAAVYHRAESLSWLEAALDAVMVMTGLGLVDALHSAAAKVFTCFYAIFTAVVFYAVLAIVFAPIVHRFLHAFHLETEQEKE
ncbi:MAG: hypothetical protein KGK03_01085 [Candidatus Omnitrophica bacterium]|nr:hypothetical protein [Candidatus Omnitrophota bacterium]MDE2221648.1 hypothetical protein [Candidatus Omnitrophota bacterium]